MEQDTVVNPKVVNKRDNKKVIVLYIAVSVVMIGILSWLVFFTYRASLQADKRLDELEQSIQGLEQSILIAIDDQTGVLTKTVRESSDEIISAIELMASDSTALTGRRISDTNSRIQRLERIYTEVLEEQRDIQRKYADLLAEQKKKTLESLYSDVQITDRMTQGLELIKQEKYHQASELFSIVSTEQPWNNEARFYELYSLFLSNKYDRSQYRKIKEGFALLNRNGYNRSEMTEVLEIINTEEKGIVPMEVNRP